MTKVPSNGSNGRDPATGRFLAGNAGGLGNPLAAKVHRLRTALVDAVSEDDLQEVIASLVDKAKSGDVQAAKVLFERTLGPPIAVDIMARLEALEDEVRGGP